MKISISNNMRKFKVLILLLLGLSSCAESTPECLTPVKGKAVLVNFRVAKHSHMFLKNPDTNITYDIGSLGGRREPNIKIGDTINVEYCNNKIIVNQYLYVKDAVNRTTRYLVN